MKIRLQQFGHKESTYARPNQRWECGWTCEGNPCEFGPDGKGHCTAHAQAECTPQKEGDRWMCMRLGAFGGPCEKGPHPDGTCCRPEPEHPVCQPRLSLRAKRGRLVFASIAITLGVLVWGLCSGSSLSFVSAGPLTHAHAGIGIEPDAIGGSEPGDMQAQNCVKCHSAGDGSAVTWLAAAFEDRDAMHESKNCLQCHFRQFHDGASEDGGVIVPEEPALFIHSVNQHWLEASTAERSKQEQGDVRASLAFAKLSGNDDLRSAEKLACATCHQEHRGANHDLSFMSDTRCQVCHVQQFASFNDGHPDFKSTRTQHGISFDHIAHAPRISPSDGKLNCAHCHVADDRLAGREMQIKPYTHMCGACHTADVQKGLGSVTVDKGGIAGLIQPPREEIKELFDDDVFEELNETFAEDVAGWVEDNGLNQPFKLVMLPVMWDAGDDWPHPEDWPALLPLDEQADEEPEDTQFRHLFEFRGLEMPTELLLAGDPEAVPTLIRVFENKQPSKLDADDQEAFAGHMRKLMNDLAAGDKTALIMRIAHALGTQKNDPRVEALALQMQRSWSAARGMFDEVFEADLPEIDEDAMPDETGWEFLFDEGAIIYRPVGHGDPLLAAWMDVIVASAPERSSSNPEDVPGATDAASAEYLSQLRLALFEKVEEDRAGCMKCHSIEDNGNMLDKANRIVNWHGGRQTKRFGYRKFDHRLHVKLKQGLQSCSSCHAMPQGATNAGDTTHGFLPHSQQSCAQCHAPQGIARNNCVTCHVYHVNRP